MKQIFHTLAHLNEVLSTDKVYLVGGSARDELLGYEYDDYDISVGLKPEEVIARLDSHNIKHDDKFSKYGVFKAYIDGLKVTLSCMRLEGDYLDGRHPSKVEFIDDLTKDALRRDFTINAIYLDSNRHIYDPCNGMKDIEDHVIRMIGDPKARIYEDRLRIMRAYRFAKVRNLRISPELLDAIKDFITDENNNLIEFIESPKVQEEVRKLKDELAKEGRN